MRVFSWLVLASVCVIVPSARDALGDSFKIASFSDARSYKYFGGVTWSAGSNPYIKGYDWYSTTRNLLQAPGIFWPGVTVSFHEISDARTDLTGQDFDLLIMNEVVPLGGAAAADEAAAIAEFVLGGGCLTVIADTLEGGQGIVMGNKTLAALDLGTGQAGRYGAPVFTGPSGEVSTAGHFILDPGSGSNLVWGGGFNYQIDGTDAADPFSSGESDLLANARFGVTDHVRVDPGAWSQVIGKRALSGGLDPPLSNIVMEITGDRIDAGLSQSGAGNVMVVGDTIFGNDMVSPIAPGFMNPDPSNNNNNYNNARILLNFVEQQAIPEPASLTLLLIGLAALAAGRFWRRGATQ